MAKTLNSKIILANGIRLDREHKNVLNYSESEMVSLVQSKAIASASNYSFVRSNKKSLLVEFPYSTCLLASYIAFQNPDYSNKWFFAFVDEVNYKSEATTELIFSIDSWATWFSTLTIDSSFVLREHVNDDTVGLHTVPENVETGEYIANTSTDIFSGSSSYIAMFCSDLVDALDINRSISMYGGVYSGCVIMLFQDRLSAGNFIKAMTISAKGDAIIAVNMIPTEFASSITFTHAAVETVKGTWEFDYAYLPYTTEAQLLDSTGNISLQTSLNGYTPKNNKMKCYPFNYLYVTNNNGSDAIYRYEDFVNNTPSFKTYGVPAVGSSIRCIPISYKKLTDTSSSLKSYSYGINAGKFSLGSWSSDTFINWLTSNCVNIATDVVKTGMSAASGDALGTFGGIASTLGNLYQHSLIPDQAKGNVNGGDVSFGLDKNSITLYKMSVKSEYAKIIDDYLTRKGYQVNTLKVPNITGRRYWNYIQIATDDDLGFGNVPQNYMEEINRIARTGVTIWHSHDNIGNFNLDNSIV